MRPWEFESHVNVIVDVAIVIPVGFRADTLDAVEILSAVTLYRYGVNLAEEDAGGVHLMTSKFSHQTTARGIVESPVDQLFGTFVAKFLQLAGFLHLQQSLLIGLGFLRNAPLSPAVAAWKAVVAMPLSPDELDVAQQTLTNQVVRVVIQHAVMAP